MAMGAPGPDQVSRIRSPPVPRQGLQWVVGIPPGLPTAVLARRRHHRRGDPRARRRAHGGGGEDRHRRLDDVQPLRLRRGTAGGRGDRRAVPALLGWQVLARRRSRPRRALSARGTRAVPVPLEMRAVGRRTPAAAGNRRTTSRWPRSLFPAWASAPTRSPTPTRRPARAGCGSPTGGSSGPRAGRPRRRPNRSFLHPEESPRGPRSSSSGGPPAIPTATRSPTTISSSPDAPT